MLAAHKWPGIKTEMSPLNDKNAFGAGPTGID
jgi:hypothetical protein